MNQAEIKKLPYYQSEPGDQRVIILMPFFENGKFIIPFKAGEKITLIEAVEAQSGSYFAHEPENPEIDIYLPLLELITQHITSAKLINLVQTIVSDVINFGASLEKYLIIVQHSRGKLGASTLISTELEFLFNNVRSLYDQLQKIIKDIWDKIELIDVAVKRQQLPKSFRDVALYGSQDNIRTADEIVKKYGLPEPIAKFYVSESEFFKLCRVIRVDIVHNGKSFSDGPIFPLENGFAVDVTEFPYSNFNIWEPEHLQNEKLGSVQVLIAHIVYKTIAATTSFAEALASCVRLPEPIGADWHVFIRHPYLAHLQNINKFIDVPWVDE